MKRFDSLLLGTVIGVLTPVLTVLVFYFARFSEVTLKEYVFLLFANRFLFAPIVSLSGLPNLLFFYLFINRDKIKTARGIILATFIIVIAVLIIKFWK